MTPRGVNLVTDNVDKHWFIDGRTGVAATYGDLLADLNRTPGSSRPLCQPASTQDALREITASLIFGTELTLFDSDFGERELQALGYNRSQLNQSQTVVAGKPIGWPALQGLAAGGSSARLGLFTSGSTGLPKLVWQTAANLARAVRVSPRHADAVWAFAYNPTHVAGLQVYLQALANGCPVVDVYGLDRAGVLAAMERHGVTHISATPSFYRLLLPTDRAMAGVRSVTLGGESSDAALIGRLRPLFPLARFHNIYASTEAGTLLTAEGDVFSIAEGLVDRVVIKDGTLRVHRSLLGVFVAPGANPPTPHSTSSGLRRDSSGGVATDEEDGARASREATQGSSGPASSGTGEDWYDTGDVVEVVSTDPLRFRIVARERDWVNVGGSKVNPREVEAVLEEFPGVRKVRVSGRANSVMGNILSAEIEWVKPEDGGRRAEAGRQRTTDDGQRTTDDGGQRTDDGGRSAEDGRPTEQDLRAWLAERLQPFKVPRLIRFVDNIAQTRTGKVRRTEG